MPTLDLSIAILAPELADRFTVQRRAEVVNGYGEGVTTPTTINNVVGVVTAASPNDLMRLPESTSMGRSIVVVTKFRLRGPASGFQPDIVIWGGDSFIIKHIDNYQHFGTGFIQAIAESIDYLDNPPS